MVTNETPEERRLQHTSFVIHATRGVIRNQKTRRRVMLVVLTMALVLIILGTTVLQRTLDPHERPGWFLCFWLVCAWLTITTLLLALFDLLMVRTGLRNAERELREQIESSPSNPPAKQ
jgi:hypothetical protein